MKVWLALLFVEIELPDDAPSVEQGQRAVGLPSIVSGLSFDSFYRPDSPGLQKQ